MRKTESGNGWESNPPNRRNAGHAGFEDRGGHQTRVRSRERKIARFLATTVVPIILPYYSLYYL